MERTANQRKENFEEGVVFEEGETSNEEGEMFCG